MTTLHFTYAQINISGIVTDESDGSPLIGVNISVQGTTTGTITDLDGTYAIAVPDAASVLEFSYTGYTLQQIPVGNQTTINVSLAGGTVLDEVVVVGYGTRKKSDLTGAVSQIGSDDFEEQPVVRIGEALQGRAAGVSVNRSSGSPGGDLRIRIRGANSITGTNDPLIVIDGIIGGDLLALNPNDIASMEILKDASATAIYGSRGSNGVILISTKKGTTKPSINLTINSGISQVPKFIDVLGAADFARAENARRVRNGGTEIFDASEISSLESSGGVDYQDEIFQTGTNNDVQLSASGKEGGISYFLSGNYLDQTGIVINTGYKRISGRANISSAINDKLNIGVNLFATRESTLNYLDDRREFQGSLVLRALTWDPTTPIFNESGAYNDFSTRALAHLGYNPVADLTNRNSTRVEDRINANINLSYQIASALNFTVIGGLSSASSNTESYFTTPPFPDAGFGSSKNSSLQLSNILTWQQTFGQHDLKLTGVYEIQEGQGSFNGYNATDFTVPGGFFLAELTNGQSIFNDFSESAIESFMGRAEYILSDQLFLTGTIRRDKSSRFRDGNNVGIFPSVAVAYSLLNSSFIDNSNFFSNLKLRAGWGQVGNQNIAPYSTYPGVNVNSRYTYDGATISPGSSPAGYGNPDLTWETTSQYNVGIDLGFLDSRLNLTVDFYNKNTTDLLLQVPVPDFAGGGSVLRNVGEVQNTGIDLALAGAIVNTGAFRWDAIFTLSKVNNEVISLGGPDEIQGQFDNIDGSGRALNIIQVGEPLGQFYGETFLGTWKNSEADQAEEFGLLPGDAKYLRDADGVTVLQAIGNGTPDLTWGFNNTITWNNFDLNFFFNAASGFQILNVSRGIIVGSTGNQRSYLSTDQLNAWSANNETDIPVGGQNRTASSRYVEDGSFIRLNNLSLGYTLRNIPGISSLKLSVSSQNLLLITDFTGYDPEGSDRNYNGGNNDTAAGVNVGAYPNPRVVTFGVKVGF